MSYNDYYCFDDLLLMFITSLCVKVSLILIYQRLLLSIGHVDTGFNRTYWKSNREHVISQQTEQESQNNTELSRFFSEQCANKTVI